jgi:hypothetical protein
MGASCVADCCTQAVLVLVVLTLMGSVRWICMLA